MPGIEPGASYMQSMRSTTELHPLLHSAAYCFCGDKLYFLAFWVPKRFLAVVLMLRDFRQETLWEPKDTDALEYAT